MELRRDSRDQATEEGAVLVIGDPRCMVPPCHEASKLRQGGQLTDVAEPDWARWPVLLADPAPVSAVPVDQGQLQMWVTATREH